VVNAASGSDPPYAAHYFAWAEELQYCYACTYAQAAERGPDTMHHIYATAAYAPAGSLIEGRPAARSGGDDDTDTDAFVLAHGSSTCTETSSMIGDVRSVEDCAAKTSGAEHFAFSERLKMCSACTARGYSLRVSLANHAIYARVHAAPVAPVPVTATGMGARMRGDGE
jgi:hypothetical protein